MSQGTLFADSKIRELSQSFWSSKLKLDVPGLSTQLLPDVFSNTFSLGKVPALNWLKGVKPLEVIAISVYCFLLVQELEWRKQNPSITRWFKTVSAQPLFKTIFPEVEFHAKPVKFTPTKEGEEGFSSPQSPRGQGPKEGGQEEAAPNRGRAASLLSPRHLLSCWRPRLCPPAFDVAPDWESYSYTVMDVSDEKVRKFQFDNMFTWDEPVEGQQ
ncbi:hypothetical protein JCM33374_g6165 [Metschnikowia sp. JCM 33374]|nr:hypothetical protein JCM33374_g6165 [Metschnikowia sp. JCM 33374]